MIITTGAMFYVCEGWLEEKGKYFQHLCLGKVAQRYGSFLGRGMNQDIRYMK